MLLSSTSTSRPSPTPLRCLRCLALSSPSHARRTAHCLDGSIITSSRPNATLPAHLPLHRHLIIGNIIRNCRGVPLFAWDTTPLRLQHISQNRPNVVFQLLHWPCRRISPIAHSASTGQSLPYKVSRENSTPTFENPSKYDLASSRTVKPYCWRRFLLKPVNLCQNHKQPHLFDTNQP